MKITYRVPTGDHFTIVSNIRNAKRLARENREGSQWFFVDRQYMNGRTVSRYRFNGRKWCLT